MTTLSKVETDFQNDLDETLKIKSNIISKLDFLENKLQSSQQILIEIKDKYNIKSNNLIDLNVLHIYIQNFDKLIIKYENKIYLGFDEYGISLLELYREKNISEVDILNLAKEINKQENGNLLIPIGNQKWWNLIYWLNKSKIKKQEEENKITYIEKETKIINILNQYKKQIENIIDDMKFIDDIFYDYLTLEKRLLNNEDITIVILNLKQSLGQYQLYLTNIEEYNKQLNILKEDLIENDKKINAIQLNLENLKINKENEEIFIGDSQETKNEIITKTTQIERVDILIKDFFNENKFNMFVSYCSDKNIVKLNELINFNFDSLLSIKGFGVGKVKNIKDKFDSCNGIYHKDINNDRKQLFIDTLNEIKFNSKYIRGYEILKKRASGKTLEIIGEEQGITRERVRQLESKIIKEKMTFLLCMNDEYIINNLNNKYIFSIDELSYLVEYENDLKVIDYCLKRDICDSFKYFHELEKYIVNNDVEDIKTMLEHTLTNIDDIFSFDDDNIDFEEILSENFLDFLSIKDYENYLINTHYKRIGNFLIKGSASKSKIYGHIVKEFFKDGINFSSESEVSKLRFIVEKEFDVIIDENDRALKSNIDRVCILRNISTLIHPDHIDIDYKLLSKIKDYIDNYDLSTIYMVDIYEEFKFHLDKYSNIDNKHFLHGVLRYFYDNEYTFTRDTLYKNNKKLNSGEILEQYLREKGRPMNKIEIKEDLKGWTDIMFSINSNIRKDIIVWDTNHYMISDIINIDKTHIEKLKYEIELSIDKNDGYTNSIILYNKLKTEMKDFFDINNIKNYNNLYAILIYIFGDEFRFKRPHILKNNILNDVNIVNIIKYFIKDKECFTIQEVKNIMYKLEFKESTIHATMSRINKEIYLIGDNKYRFL